MDINTLIKAKEVKEYFKGLKFVLLNMKHIRSIVYGKYTHSVRSLLKAEENSENKVRSFNATWILKNVKRIVPGIDAKTNLCISLYTAMITSIKTRQYNNKANNTYLAHLKSKFEMLKLARGEHMLENSQMMGN